MSHKESLNAGNIYHLKDVENRTGLSSQYILLLIEKYNFISPAKSKPYEFTEEDIRSIDRFKLLKKTFYFPLGQSKILALNWDTCVAISNNTYMGPVNFIYQHRDSGKDTSELTKIYYQTLASIPIFTDQDAKFFVSVATQTRFAVELFADENRITVNQAREHYNTLSSHIGKIGIFSLWIQLNKQDRKYFDTE